MSHIYANVSICILVLDSLIHLFMIFACLSSTRLPAHGSCSTFLHHILCAHCTSTAWVASSDCPFVGRCACVRWPSRALAGMSSQWDMIFFTHTSRPQHSRWCARYASRVCVCGPTFLSCSWTKLAGIGSSLPFCPPIRVE